jgi:hypothetical protein
MTDEDKRSATDILLTIEADLKTVDIRNQNIENLLKILLNKLNKSDSIRPIPQQQNIVVPTDVINKDNFDNRPKTNRFSEMAAEQGINLNNSPNTIVAKTETDMTESKVRAPTRGQRGPKGKGSKCSVSQIINIDNGSPLFLANVEILDENNDLISQGRTNSKGRWMMALTPGDYQAHVVKRYPPDSGKKSIDVTYTITIPQSDKPIELDSYLID